MNESITVFATAIELADTVLKKMVGDTVSKLTKDDTIDVIAVSLNYKLNEKRGVK